MFALALESLLLLSSSLVEVYVFECTAVAVEVCCYIAFYLDTLENIGLIFICAMIHFEDRIFILRL